MAPATKPARRSPALRRRLDALLAQHDPTAHRDADPVSFVHRYERDHDREVVGLIAALLAFGQVKSVRASIGRALAVLEGPEGPAARLDALAGPPLTRALRGFVHRIYRGEHLATLLTNAAHVRREEGSLGAAFAARLTAHGELREALADLADRLRGPAPARGLAHLIPDPRAGSAVKRPLLYLRWMCRPADGVDLGIWPVSPARLIVPVDTHIHRIALNLGLTSRPDASWRTAEEITAVFRRFDPDDPVKYDFALCHLGISRQCPSRRDPDKCAACVLRPVCLQWR